MIGINFHAIGMPIVGLTEEEKACTITRDVFFALLDELATRPEVNLTFDDGFASDVEIALPALIERGMSASFFPVAGRFGWSGYVDPADIRALSSAGMTIGSHGMNHRPWRCLDVDSIHEELIVARSLIAEAAGMAVTTVACPFGSYDRHVLRALRECGYERVYTSDSRRSRIGAWLQPRYTVMSHDNVQTVRQNILAPRPLGDRVGRTVIGRFKAWR